MKEELFIMLGTGQMVLKDINDRSYRKAKYYVPDLDDSIVVETPFVGEAILRLHPHRFSKVYIFGTVKSMWETLYSHSLSLDENAENNDWNEDDVKYFGKVCFAVENGTIGENLELLDYVAAAYQKHIGIDTECHLIPIGENEDEIWQIFDILTKVKTESAKISFDITHGLRFQPFFFLIALFYLNSVKTSIRIGSVFYGGLELMNNPPHNGKAPILEFKVFSELIEWINAAKIFDKYKDFSALSKLLEKHNNMSDIAESLNNFSNCYKMNFFSNINEYSNNIIKNIENTSESSSKPFNLLKDSILAFPNEINNCKTNLARILKIANHQWKYRNYGFVVIALWEAVLEKFILTMDNKYSKRDVQNALPVFLNYRNSSEINQVNKNLYSNLKALQKIRNSIAHLDGESSKDIEIADIHKDVEKLFNYFYNHLQTLPFTNFKELFRNIYRTNYE